MNGKRAKSLRRKAQEGATPTQLKNGATEYVYNQLKKEYTKGNIKVKPAYK